MPSATFSFTCKLKDNLLSEELTDWLSIYKSDDLERASKIAIDLFGHDPLEQQPSIESINTSGNYVSGVMGGRDIEDFESFISSISKHNCELAVFECYVSGIAGDQNYKYGFENGDKSPFKVILNKLSLGNPTASLSADVIKGNFKKCKELLDQGANPNLLINGRPGVLEVLFSHRPNLCSLIQKFVEAGANVDVCDQESKQTLLMLLIRYYGTMNCIADVADSTKEINATDINGDTALHHAFSYGYEDKRRKLIKTLLDKGANVCCKNNSGKSVLDIANEYGNKSIQKLVESAS